jgi:hypothetical protein
MLFTVAVLPMICRHYSDDSFTIHLYFCNDVILFCSENEGVPSSINVLLPSFCKAEA